MRQAIARNPAVIVNGTGNTEGVVVRESVSAVAALDELTGE